MHQMTTNEKMGAGLVCGALLAGLLALGFLEKADNDALKQAIVPAIGSICLGCLLGGGLGRWREGWIILGGFLGLAAGFTAGLVWGGPVLGWLETILVCAGLGSLTGALGGRYCGRPTEVQLATPQGDAIDQAVTLATPEPATLHIVLPGVWSLVDLDVTVLLDGRTLAVANHPDGGIFTTPTTTGQHELSLHCAQKSFAFQLPLPRPGHYELRLTYNRWMGDYLARPLVHHGAQQPEIRPPTKGGSPQWLAGMSTFARVFWFATVGFGGMVGVLLAVVFAILAAENGVAALLLGVVGGLVVGLLAGVLFGLLFAVKMAKMMPSRKQGAQPPGSVEKLGGWLEKGLGMLEGSSLSGAATNTLEQFSEPANRKQSDANVPTGSTAAAAPAAEASTREPQFWQPAQKLVGIVIGVAWLLSTAVFWWHAGTVQLNIELIGHRLGALLGLALVIGVPALLLGWIVRCCGGSPDRAQVVAGVVAVLIALLAVAGHSERDARMGLIHRGDRLAGMARWQQAEQAYTQAINIGGTDGVHQAYAQRAVVRLRLGQVELALADLAEAIRTADDDRERAQYYERRGLILWQDLGRLADAAGDFEDALRLDPTLGSAREHLEKIRRQVGQ